MDSVVESEVETLRNMSLFGAEEQARRYSLTLSNTQLNPKDNSTSVVLCLSKAVGRGTPVHVATVNYTVTFSMQYPEKECGWALEEYAPPTTGDQGPDEVTRTLPEEIAGRLLLFLSSSRKGSAASFAGATVSPFMRDVLQMVQAWRDLQLPRSLFQQATTMTGGYTRATHGRTSAHYASKSLLVRSAEGSTIVEGGLSSKGYGREEAEERKGVRVRYTALLLPNGTVASFGSAAAPAAVSFTSEAKGPLPTLLRPPSLFMQTTGGSGEWSEVQLHARGAPHLALRANAAFCERIGLRQVARVLDALSRVYSGGIGVLSISAAYIRQVLVPVLREAFTTLAAARQPFWAGVAVCCLVLPQRCTAAGGQLASEISRLPEAYGAVSLVERVFTALHCVMKMCEARLVREALRQGSIPMMDTKPQGEVPFLCALCGVRVADDAASPHRSEGSLIVQCVHCGHGGHAAHMTEWWADPLTECCPQGCNCQCVY